MGWCEYDERLIPAHAGKTSCTNRGLEPTGAHPRSRGENYPPCLPRRPRRGSSPLTRGKPARRERRRTHRGLIPAHAGKTKNCYCHTCAKAAHPRSRGENDFHLHPKTGKPGSSPLTRGKRLSGVCPSLYPGLIPAHAGKTAGAVQPRRDGAAHPRSRGENAPMPTVVSWPYGSSPLTRGKRRLTRSELTHARLIPAHAGKTSPTRRGPGQRTAHPRSRGENVARLVGREWRRGSSPLTRGKHFPTCAFTAQIDQILETLELAVSSGSYSVWVACATDAPQDQVRSIGLVLPSSRGAS